MLFLVLFASKTVLAVTGEFYSQTVYLYKFGNPITQNKLTLIKENKDFDLYGGIWLDQDAKTNEEEAYTDSMVAPLVGARSKVFGPGWLFSRLFLETRYVYRTTSFPDDREKETYEARGGILGYGYIENKSSLFLENYYALFYTHLYGGKTIAQGWARQGVRIASEFDLFNEIFIDTFDQTRDQDGTLDLRPGVRWILPVKNLNIQLIHQLLYHFTNLEFSGRYEMRSTLIVGLYF